MQSLCTLRDHCRQGPRNTHCQAGATPYLGRTSTGWIAPACGWRTHSITSSAIASSPGGKLRLSALAVLRLITKGGRWGLSIDGRYTRPPRNVQVRKLRRVEGLSMRNFLSGNGGYLQRLRVR